MEKKVKSYRKANNIAFKSYYFSKDKNIFKYIYNVFKYIFYRPEPLHAKGTHIITGYPGAGKTLLVNKVIQEVDSSKYFFYSNINEFKGDNIKKLNMDKMFSNKKQVYKLKLTDNRGRHLYGVIFDEINLNFNKRTNQSREYNDRFIGLIEFIVTHRHQGIPRIYFIGQKLELQDTQLLSLFKYQHDIVKKRTCYAYWHYYKKYVDAIPVKLFIEHRLKNELDEFIAWKRQKYKIKWYDLESYDTLALSKDYELLPEL